MNIYQDFEVKLTEADSCLSKENCYLEEVEVISEKIVLDNIINSNSEGNISA